MERDKIIKCADDIINHITDKIIMERINKEFGVKSIDLANKVYNQIKLRM